MESGEWTHERDIEKRFLELTRAKTKGATDQQLGRRERTMQFQSQRFFGESSGIQTQRGE
jgi:hypothetical protein